MKAIILSLGLTLGSLFLPNLANAQAVMTDDQVNQVALKEAQEQIVDPVKRIEVIKVTPQGKSVDQQVKELMGNNSEAMYKTAADFLPYVLQMGHGDPTKMAEILRKANRDPASFAESLPANLKQQVKELSEQVKPLPEPRKP